MKIMLMIAIIICLNRSEPLFAGGPSSCPSTYTNWSTSWSDAGKYTKYKLKAPVEVFIGCPFDITATVTDNQFPDNWVGSGWAIFDTYSSAGTGRVKTALLQGSVNGEPDDISTVNGQWQRLYTQTYIGTPYDHRLEFAFKDLGSSTFSSTSGMNWTGGIIGNITLDPFLITLVQNISFRVDQQSTTAIPATVLNPSGTPLTCRWLEGGNVLQASQAVDGSGNAPLYMASLSSQSAGTHTYTLEVTDGTSIATATVSVVIAPPLNNSSGGTSVSIMAGWWLLPGMLAGIGFFIRRREK